MAEKIVNDPRFVSSGLPEPGTPAHEWASNTESLLSGSSVPGSTTTAGVPGQTIVPGGTTGTATDNPFSQPVPATGITTGANTTLSSAPPIPPSTFGATTVPGTVLYAQPVPAVGTTTGLPGQTTVPGTTVGAPAGSTIGTNPNIANFAAASQAPPSFQRQVPNDALATPGLDIPGAFPREFVNSVTPGDTLAETAKSVAGTTAEVAKTAAGVTADAAKTAASVTAETAQSAAGVTVNATSGLVETARQYLPAQEDVTRALSNAAETAKNYLPQSVSKLLPATHTAVNQDLSGTSLPSQELSAEHHGSSGGVGVLPGAVSEAGVAKLPLEREQEGSLPSADATQPAIRTTTNTQSLAPSLPASVQSPSTYSIKAQAGSSASSFIDRADDTPTPGIGGGSMGVGGHTGALGGVGDLPVSRNETGVAILPEERKSSNKDTTSSGLGNIPGSTTSGTGVVSHHDSRTDSKSQGAFTGTGVLSSDRSTSGSAHHPDEGHDSRARQTFSGAGILAGAADSKNQHASSGTTGNLSGDRSGHDSSRVPGVQDDSKNQHVLGAIGALSSDRGTSNLADTLGGRDESGKQRSHDGVATEPSSHQGSSGIAAALGGDRSGSGTAHEEKYTSPANQREGASGPRAATDLHGGLTPAERERLREKDNNNLSTGTPASQGVVGGTKVDKARETKDRVEDAVPGAGHHAAHHDPKNGPPAGFDGYGEGYHPADLHPMGKGAVPADSATESGSVPSEGTAVGEGHGHGDSEHHRAGSSASGHKPGFMSKLKGEAKIIAGKLGKNEEKIEEGKRLKTGGV